MNIIKTLSRCNKSGIFSVLAIIGVGVTMVELHKADVKTEKQLEGKEDLTDREVFKETWKNYIPAAITGSLTVACIVGSNIACKKQNASLMSAYTMLNKRHMGYRQKVVELYGEEVDRSIASSLIEERANDELVISNPGILGSSCLGISSKDPELKRVFYDDYSKRYFESTMSKVLEAEYHLNRNFTLGSAIEINEFYEFLGISIVPEGRYMGWMLDDGIYWIDFDHSIKVMEDGSEVVVISYNFWPMPFSEMDL